MLGLLSKSPLKATLRPGSLERGEGQDVQAERGQGDRLWVKGQAKTLLVKGKIDQNL